MGGWFVDIFVEYLFRVMTRMIKRRGSGTWPVAKATVTRSGCPRAMYGCDAATHNARAAPVYLLVTMELDFEISYLLSPSRV